jgi:SAM-dependent methyltransferase
VTDWPAYVDQFHRDHPGITEAMLARSFDDGRNAYEWLAEPLSRGGVTVDLGCGSAPTFASFDRWLGVDLSIGELQAARAQGRGPLIRARAEAVPLATATVDTVTAVMSLMVVDDPAAVLAEAARLLRPGGRLAILLPAQQPLTSADRVRYGLLLLTLGRSAMPFPHPEVERRASASLDAAGFEPISDDCRRFEYEIRDRKDADLLVESLYLPGVGERRRRAARRAAQHWGHHGLGVPLRRVIARRAMG